MDTFLHTVDKRATPAVWRESLEQSIKREEEEERKREAMENSLIKEKTVAELIEERKGELEDRLIRENTDLELKVGKEKFDRIMELTEMHKDEFKATIRIGWKTKDYIQYAFRMIVFMIRGFSLRKLYVEPTLFKEENNNLSSAKFQSNWEFLACLSCQPQYRTKTMLDKIFYFIKPLNIMAMFPPDMAEEVCRYIVYIKLDHGRVLIHQHRRPERFYIVFEGKINLIRKIELSDGKSVIKSVGWIRKHEHMEISEIEAESESSHQLVTVGACQLLYIDVDDFLYLRKVQDKIPRLYLLSLPLFKRYPVERLLQLPGAIESHFYPSGTLVCKNLKSSPVFFICKTGHCAILRRQAVTDIKKTKEYHKASFPEAVGSHKTFFHAYETGNRRLLSHQQLTSQHKMRTSTPLKKEEKSHESVEKSIKERDSIVTKRVFVQIGLFTKDQVMGIHEQDLTANEGVNNSLSLVSQGAEVVKVQKQRFFHLAVPQTLIEVQNFFKTYTLESEVQKEIDDKESWPYFRKNFVSKFIREKERQKAMLQPRGTHKTL